MFISYWTRHNWHRFVQRASRASAHLYSPVIGILFHLIGIISIILSKAIIVCCRKALNCTTKHSVTPHWFTKHHIVTFDSLDLWCFELIWMKISSLRFECNRLFEWGFHGKTDLPTSSSCRYVVVLPFVHFKFNLVACSNIATLKWPSDSRVENEEIAYRNDHSDLLWTNDCFIDSVKR